MTNLFTIVVPTKLSKALQKGIVVPNLNNITELKKIPNELLI